jgi:hypothetical protein
MGKSTCQAVLADLGSTRVGAAKVVAMVETPGPGSPAQLEPLPVRRPGPAAQAAPEGTVWLTRAELVASAEVQGEAEVGAAPAEALAVVVMLAEAVAVVTAWPSAATVLLRLALPPAKAGHQRQALTVQDT